jgi:hypothetical protein
MLQAMLELFRASKGGTLSIAEIAIRLNLSPEMVEQLLHTLVERGRICPIHPAGKACAPCPLREVCPGGPQVAHQGYALVEKQTPLIEGLRPA